MLGEILEFGEKFSDAKLYRLIRRPLNLLFIGSIASFLFERFYFKYRFLEIADYQGIATYFVRGGFFVPLCVFVLVGATCSTFVATLIYFPTEGLAALAERRKWLSKYTRRRVEKFVSASKKSKTKALQEMIKQSKKERKEFIRDFDWIKDIHQFMILIGNGYVATCFYYSNIHYFGPILFWVVSIVFVVTFLGAVFLFPVCTTWTSLEL